MKNLYQVRRTKDGEVTQAFAVLQRVADWLSNQGHRQRIAKTTMETYQQWQLARANFLVLDESEIAGVFSVPLEPFTEWPALEIDGPVPWLRALATNPSYRNEGVGAFAISSACQIVGTANTLYLDCVSGFLPAYYQKHGFEIVAQQSKRYADEDQPFEITLLKSIAMG